MATSKDNDLIGYDPLAWMEGSAEINDEIVVNDDDDNALETAEDMALPETSDAGASEIQEDEIVADEIDGENNNESVETADDCINAGDDMSNEGALDDAVATDSESLMPEQVGEAQFDLDATLTIQNVVKLHEKLKDLLAIHDQIEINASDVSSIDTATLQLLVSLKKDEAKLQKKVTIIYPSPRFVESAQLLGLLDVLDVHEA